MFDEISRQLYRIHAAAHADLYLKREVLFDQFQAAYQDSDHAAENLRIALKDWTRERFAAELERSPTRFGVPRGAWWTSDRFAQGGNARAEAANATLAKLPTAVRALADAEGRERQTWNAYENYCRDHGREPSAPGDPPQVRIPERRDDLSWLKGMRHRVGDEPDRDHVPDRKLDRERDRDR
jgi:hypothetical protein